MSQLQLELDDKILRRVKRLAAERGLTIEQFLAELVEQAAWLGEKASDKVLGLFSDEPDLMDEVIEDILQSREDQPWRAPHG